MILRASWRIPWCSFFAEIVEIGPPILPKYSFIALE